MKDQQLCGCITCQQAVTRAVGLVEKMLMDDECPYAAVAVGRAMMDAAIGVAVGESPGVVEKLMAVEASGKAANAIIGHMSGDGFSHIVAETRRLVKAVREKHDKEAKGA